MTLRPYIYIHFIICTSITSTASLAEFIPLKIATGGYHTCVLSTEGAIKCWGYNYHSQIGNVDGESRGNEPDSMGPNLPLIDLGLNVTDKTVDICAGGEFTCALTQAGRVKCWGDNRNGQLGQGLQANKSMAMGKALPFSDLGNDFKAKSLVCGDTHACALSDKGLVKCWGNNSSGALGLGDNVTRGKRSEDMGDKLPVLTGLTNVLAISAGDRYSCAASAEGVRCWGTGREGQLGLESADSRGGTPETIPGKSPYIELTADAGEKILSITASKASTCALMTKLEADTNSSFVKCWGYNPNGALGTGSTIPYGLKSGTMGAALPRLNLALDEIVSVNAHWHFACALSKSGRVKCWGINEEGRLGLGDLQLRGALPSDMGKNLPEVDLGLPVKALSAGSVSVHSCAILINNQIKCWGYNVSGQLGYENSIDVGDKVGQMGDALPFVRLK